MSAPHEDDWAPEPTRKPTPEPTPKAKPAPSRKSTPPDRETEQQPELDESAIDALGAVLRDRMQIAVAGLEPRPGTLDALRRAVPARRRRRHAAMATTAVTVFAVSAGAALAARGSLLEKPEPTRAGGAEVGNLMSTGTSGVQGGGSGHGPAPVGGLQLSSQPSPSSSGTLSATSLSQTAKAPPPSSASSNPFSSAQTLSACQSSSVLSVVGTQNAAAGGVVYETVVGTVKSACTLVGTPMLTVSGGAGRVVQRKPDPTVTPLLAELPTGLSLVLAPGDRFEFQLAWVPLACSTPPPPTTMPTSLPTSGSSGSPTTLPPTPGSSAVATVSATAPTPTQPTPGGTSGSSAPAAVSSYSVSYAVSGTQPQQTAAFAAACGATLYVTDYFPPDAKSLRHGGDASTSTTATTSATSAAH